MKKKIVITIVILFVTTLLCRFSYVVYMGWSGKGEEKLMNYLDEGGAWHAQTDQIDITIYFGKLWKVIYKYEDMEGVWDILMGHGNSMKDLSIYFAEDHEVREEVRNEMEDGLEYGYTLPIISGNGRIEDEKLIIKFKDNVFLPEGVEVLVFEKEGYINDIVINREDTNEKLGNIGYKFITKRSEWKTRERDDGIYMELKEKDGQRFVTYNINGEEKTVELMFSELARENEVALFDFKYDTDEEIKEIEKFQHHYLYDNNGKICGVIKEEFGEILVYEKRIVLKFYQNHLFPEEFKEVALYKQ